MLSPLAPERQLVMMEDTDMQESCLIRLDDKQEENNNMSSTSLSALSESSSPELLDENDYDGSEFLQTENVGIVTPAKAEEKKVPEVAISAKIKSTPKPKVPVPLPALKSDNTADPGLPTKFDVLCGQSRICATHTGNRRFQVVLDIYAPKYQAAKSKQEKMMYTKEIVACIGTAGGRFLKYKDGIWVEISNVTARDKVSHALRTKVQSWKKQQTEKASSFTAAKKKTTQRKRRRSTATIRRSASSVVPSASHVATVSFDGSTTSSTSIMDELLRTQREIFANLTQNDKACQPHPLRKAESWS